MKYLFCSLNYILYYIFFFQNLFVVLLWNLQDYPVFLCKILYTIKLQYSTLFLAFYAKCCIVSIYLNTFSIKIENRFFYYSDSPNAWFLDVDIADAGNSIVTSYTDGFVQTLNVATSVRYLTSITIPFSMIFSNLHLSRMNIGTIYLTLWLESSLFLRYFLIGCAVCIWDNGTDCLSDYCNNCK